MITHTQTYRHTHTQKKLIKLNEYSLCHRLMGGRGVAGVALNALHVKCFYQGFDAKIPRQATRLAQQTTTTMS